jgi:ribose transport system ATP-binding protein
MLFNELSYLDNLCFSLDWRLPEVWRDNKVREGIRREYKDILGADVFDMRIDALNEKQKFSLVYTRIAIQRPKVVFCLQPFRRADMELRLHIMELMQMLLGNGAALIILDFNLADSLSMADRLVRIRMDRPNEEYTREEFSALSANMPWTDIYNPL